MQRLLVNRRVAQLMAGIYGSFPVVQLECLQSNIQNQVFLVNPETQIKEMTSLLPHRPVKSGASLLLPTESREEEVRLS